MPDRFGNDATVFIRHEFGSFFMGWAHHRMGLAATSLSVRKHSTVVAAQDALDQAKTALIVDLLLLRVLAIDRVERKRATLVDLTVLRTLQNYLTVLSIDVYNLLAA
jgi:hypothetical protein